MAKIVKGIGWAAPLALVAAAILIPGLLGQDKGGGDVIVCEHGGNGGVAVRPEEALKNLRRVQSALKAKSDASMKPSDAWKLEQVRLHACTNKSESDISVDDPIARFTQLVFVDEATFDGVSSRLGRGSYVLFVSVKSPSNAAKLAEKSHVAWGIAPKELIDLFGIRCIPTIVVPAGKGKFKVTSVTPG
jgi:hypothetical protein